ncbi:DUF3592 domain-containing protein [Nocardiopsis valliformis]|uniref:DUF3592 domain-containing protein n=1 Tax=Nocardiopsis valliformis TaxID=239974 RepID=UPI0003467D50|nr:DUF3592 domain-containing protein [Nocardiopsis valliformis]
MNTDALAPLVPLLIVTGYLLYTGARKTLLALSRRRRELALAGSGVRTHGVVRAVHPLGRPSGRQAVTLQLHDVGRGTWDAVDESGTGSYLLREGTPVTVLYDPGDPSNVRVERAAFPDRSRGDYPLYRDGVPGPPSLAAALSPLAASLVILVIAVLVAANRADTAMGLVPPLFVVVGLGVLASAAHRLLTDTSTRPEYSASGTGTVTDCWTESRRVRRRSGGWSTVRVHPFTVYFQAADGREVHLRHSFAGRDFAPVPQQRLRLEYDPDHPPHYSLSDHPNTGRILAVVPFVVGAVFVLVGSVLAVVL